MALHVFCPSFIEESGRYELEPASWSAVVAEFEAAAAFRWRHTFPAVKYLIRSAGVDIPANVDRAGTVGGSPAMAIGESGVIFKPLRRPDLRSDNLTPAAFRFVIVRRVA